MRTNPFVGRSAELTRLQDLWSKRSASLVVVRGRRRIGKSRLVEEFAKGHTFFQLSGIAPVKGTNKQVQRDVFAQQLARQLGLPEIRAYDWSELFSLLARYAKQGRVVILLDEISWMGSKDSTFLGKLKNAWDLEFKKNAELILILCGSVSTWIEKNIVNSTAFFGRVSLHITLDELPLADCNTLLSKQGFSGSVYEVFKLLSVMGGVPWYLENIYPDRNADDNIKRLCFTKEGLLFHEFDKIFHDLFQKRGDLYKKIIEILSGGPCDFNTICQKLNYKKSGVISEYLDNLVKSGFISRDYTWLIKSGKSSRLSHFRLSDNYLRFYLKYILPNSTKIIADNFADNSFLPSLWDAAMGFQFENLVLKNRKIIKQLLNLSPQDVVADNPFFQRKSSTQPGCQIDYLIQTRLNTLFACEIKFSKNEIKTNIIEEMQHKIANLILPKGFSCFPVLIHVNGVSEAVIDSDYFTRIIDFATLLEKNSKSYSAGEANRNS